MLSNLHYSHPNPLAFPFSKANQKFNPLWHGFFSAPPILNLRNRIIQTNSEKFWNKGTFFSKRIVFFLNSKKDELCKFLDILDQHSTNILSGDSDDSTGWWIWCFHYIATVGSCPKCLQRTYQVSWVLRQLLNSNEVENGRLPKKHNGKTDANSCLAWGELVVV